MLVYPPSLDFIVAYLACLRAQVVAVPAYPPDPSKLKKNVRMFASIQASCGATVALTSEKYNMLTNVASMKERVKSLFSFGGKSSAVEWPEMKWVTTDTLTTTPCPASNEADLDQATEGDIAFLQYTSGSTATPKVPSLWTRRPCCVEVCAASPCAAMYCLQGVMVSHSNLAHNLNAITRSLHAKDKTVVVSWLPQYHDMGLIGSFLGVVCVADFARSARRPMSISLTHTLAWPQLLWRFWRLHVAVIVHQEPCHLDQGTTPAVRVRAAAAGSLTPASLRFVARPCPNTVAPTCRRPVSRTG